MEISRKSLLKKILVVILFIWGTAFEENVYGGDELVGIDVPSNQRVQLSQIKHDNLDSLLKKYVDPRGMVNYTAWKSSASDLQSLDNYLNLLSYSNGQGSHAEIMAFWINAYNAVTIKGILKEYPTSSIRNHTAKVWGYNIWKNLKLQVGDKKVSLDEMEHQILRKMNEPRIHFAIVCASMGCPRLLAEAYVADRLDTQLTTNSQSFFSDPKKFRYDSSRSTFYLSPIIKWFAEDFGSNQSEQLKRISVWIPDEETAARATAVGRGKMSFLEYDWGLNDWK